MDVITQLHSRLCFLEAPKRQREDEQAEGMSDIPKIPCNKQEIIQEVPEIPAVMYSKEQILQMWTIVSMYQSIEYNEEILQQTIYILIYTINLMNTLQPFFVTALHTETNIFQGKVARHPFKVQVKKHRQILFIEGIEFPAYRNLSGFLYVDVSLGKIELQVFDTITGAVFGVFNFNGM